MKTKMTTIVILFFGVNAFGQMFSHLVNLQVSGSGINVAELSLIHRSRENYKDISDLGSQVVMIPDNPDGKRIKIEVNRFWTMESTPFELDSTTYVPVNLYYDNETNDPRDDIYLLTIPFPVSKELVLKELEYYENEKLISANFEMAPQGQTTYK